MIPHRAPWLRTLAIAVVGLTLLALYTWVFHAVYTSRGPSSATDFYTVYRGTKALVTEGLNPYSEDVTHLIQSYIFGGPPPNGEPHHAFFYPLYTILIALPYTLLPTYAWVQAAWQVTLQVLLVAGIILTLRYFDWRPRSWLLVLIVLGALTLYPATYSIVLGQLSVVTFFLTVLVFWLIFRGEPSPWRDIIAGACLAISTIKPQMQFLIIPLLVIVGVKTRRWHFITSTAFSILLLIGLSWLVLPTWLADWLAQMRAYSTFVLVQPSFPHILTHEFTNLGDRVMWAVYALIIAWLLVEYWLLLRDPYLWNLDWTLALTLVVTPLLAPNAATYNYVVFLFALLPAMRWLLTQHMLLGLGVMAAILVGEWWLLLTTRTGTYISNVMLIPLPIITLLLMLLLRRRMSTAVAKAAEPLGQ